MRASPPHRLVCCVLCSCLYIHARGGQRRVEMPRLVNLPYDTPVSPHRLTPPAHPQQWPEPSSLLQLLAQAATVEVLLLLLRGFEDLERAHERVVHTAHTTNPPASNQLSRMLLTPERSACGTQAAIHQTRPLLRCMLGSAGCSQTRHHPCNAAPLTHSGVDWEPNL
jgi:hypothetical protein